MAAKDRTSWVWDSVGGQGLPQRTFSDLEANITPIYSRGQSGFLGTVRAMDLPMVFTGGGG